MNKYIPTIGIEVHVELKTTSKVFSNSLNDYNQSANKNVDVIDLGYPGVLPRVNIEVVHKALKAALALNCNINKNMHFDRKNYFYPDLPKGYQITQNRTPIGYDGFIEIDVDGETKKVEIERIHIEEDTCKSIHMNTNTLLNYNRAGVPLVEIVTKPVLRSGAEAMAYLKSLKELLFYLDVSDCKMEEGSMRADVNVSISNNDELGTKCEIKNIGSISYVGIAIDEEIKRQEELLNNNQKVEEETRRFDSKQNKTVLMRKKEVGNDYRYFPEPDIPYVNLKDEYIIDVKKELIDLPNDRRNKYNEKGISSINIEKLINNKELSDFLNMFINQDINFVIASNILLGDILSYLNKKEISIFNTRLKDKFLDLVNKLDKKDISSKIFKDILDELMEEDLTIDEILDKKGLVLNNNIDELNKIIEEILKNNEQSVLDYKSGKMNAFKYLIGQVMKETKGTANPKLVNDLLLTMLDNM